ncbi:MAG: hypothetical protein N4A57_01705 [Anaeromicrobium sp.]|jgi:hypothetical protein|uniref:hypothetical protein n=1 Tax=Anaeromicrobium sp. TaxID=1929132 RepID=UPI0025FF6104|nr:hypothetical protein [Anaeromicrobium sp.]MCT4592981.1 hypothetical protein [Anaeromicrobium sp.]
MRHNGFIRLLLIFPFLLLFGACSKSPSQINKNSKGPIEENKINNLNEEYMKIWDSFYADVNGDGDLEKIELIGRKDKDSPIFCMGNLKLNIRNSNSNEIIKTQLIFKNQGHHPQLVTSDINNDGAEDMLVSMTSTCNGYGHVYYGLYTFSNNELNEIDLESIRDKDTHIKFELYDEDQLILKFDGLKYGFIVPLSKYQGVLYKKIQNKEKHYDDREEFGYFPGSNFKIADYDGDGKNELKCSKIFAAEYQSEIAWIEVIYKYKDRGWTVIDAKIEPIYKRKSQSDKDKEINISDLKFGKLMCGLNYEDIIKILGKPLKEEFNGVKLQYKDETRLYINPVVKSIEINSSNYSTPRGLIVGDSKEKVRELYGEPDDIRRDGTSEFWEYLTNDLDYLHIDFVEEKVKSIMINCSNSLRK